jgi:hypothetical protein
MCKLHYPRHIGFMLKEPPTWKFCLCSAGSDTLQNNFEIRISPRIRKCFRVWLRGSYGVDSWKKPGAKNLVLLYLSRAPYLKKKLLCSAGSDTRRTTLKFEYLREFEPEFESVLVYELGAHMGSIHEKSSGQKSRATVPLILQFSFATVSHVLWWFNAAKMFCLPEKDKIRWEREHRELSSLI